MAVAVLTGHGPARRHLHIMSLFDGDLRWAGHVAHMGKSEVHTGF
jgi:hypothetical protein